MCAKQCARCGMAASYTTVFDRRTLFFWALFGLAVTIRMVSSESPDLACSSVKYAYTEKGLFREEDVPQTAIAGDHLRICERGMTCCTQEMEHRLSAQSRDEFERHVRQTIGELKSLFAFRAQKFDEFFRELMMKSKKGFHQMFVKTYGMIYETNSYIFEGMFGDLQKYYDAGNIDLGDALEGFFNRLYKKMFQVMNSQYSYNEKFLNCISEHMEEMKPFGDIPKKLTLEVKRSFVATRTFVNALGVGRDVVKVLMEVGPTPECSRSLMKMTYCPHCQGLPDLKPCANYCLGVMKECFSNYNELSSEWKNYTSALDLLAGRLENSFNIESVVDPMNIKISEAVMNFQENGQVVSQKLFDSCGRPRLGKRAANKELHFEKLSFSYQQNGEETSLSTLVQGIRKRIRKTANYWAQLPEKMCHNPEISGETPKSQQDNKDQMDCWNGLSKAKLEMPKKQSSSESAETKLETSHQNAIISQQILTLKLITDKLHHAYNGLDVNWEDSDDWVSSGSGSGSGEGPNESSTVTTFGDIYFSSSTPHPKVNRVPTTANKPKKNSGPLSTPALVLILLCTASSFWSRS